ncbi:hypothetical protein H6G97_29370 [Nostoc flagelliforme FACHB-838]|uniref:Secreted protein n=1 Tax=Nostoc flagelliforme FACHB-838 TaxID=2692904 RepID=A0ABR8DX02_9NOSO|nr:hypothetical protein [Nostoc flagelliforme]MBD2533450.1 hypothetical protein [Nostoc flagelliforme FACHB-838]
MNNLSYWIKCLGIAISGAIVFSGSSLIAQTNIDPTKIQVSDTNCSQVILGKDGTQWVCLCNGQMTDCPCPKP